MQATDPLVEELGHVTQVVSFQLASPLGGTGQAQLYCQVFGTAGNVGASYATITAEQVGNLTITG